MMTNTNSKVRHEIFFLCHAEHDNSRIADTLRNHGYITYFYDNTQLVMSSLLDTQPALVLIKHNPPDINIWDAVPQLRRYERLTGKSVPILILLNDYLQIPVIADATGLPQACFLNNPVTREQILNRVNQLIVAPPTVAKKKIVLWDSASFLSSVHINALQLDELVLEQIHSLKALRTEIARDQLDCLILTGDLDNPAVKEVLNLRKNSTSPNATILITDLTVDKDSLVFFEEYAPEILNVDCSVLELHTAIQNLLFSRTLKTVLSSLDMHHVELSGREKLYRRVVESQDDLLLKWLPDSTITFSNDAFTGKLHVNKRDIIGKLLTQFIPADDLKVYRQNVTKLLQSRQSQVYEHRLICGESGTRWFSWTSSPVSDSSGQIIEIVSDGRDVTDQKRTEYRLKEEAGEKELLLSSIPSQVWHLKGLNRYGRVNQAHAEFLGKSIMEIAGHPVVEVLSKQNYSMITSLIEEVVEKKERIQRDCLLTNFRNQQRLLTVTAVPNLDSGNNVNSMVCSAVDVTEQRFEEYTLAYKAEFEHLISEVSSSFLHHDAKHLEWSITSSLEQVARFAGADRAYLYLTSGPGSNRDMFTCWQDSKENHVTAHPGQFIGKIIQRLENMETLTIQDSQTVDDLDDSDINYFNQYSIRSALYLPLSTFDTFSGYFGFEVMEQSVVWDEDIVKLFSFYSQILLQAVQRKAELESIENERDLGIRLSKTSSLDESLDLCLVHAIKISEMDCGGVYLFDEKTQGLHLAKHTNLSDTFLNKITNIPMNSPQFKILNKGKPIFSEKHTFNQVSDKNTIDEGLKSLGVIPVYYDEKLIACVNVASHTQDTIPQHARSALISLITRLAPTIARAKIEDEIRSDWKNISNLFESLDDFIFVFDEDGNILDANTTAVKRMAYGPEKLKSMSIRDVYDVEEGMDILKTLMATSLDQMKGMNRPVVTGSGNFIPVETHVIEGRWRNVKAWYALSHDLSRVKQEERERLEFEKQLQQARKVESLGRMAGAIAHRFNNLLMGVSGNLELAEMLHKRGRDPVEKIRVARETAYKATGLSKLMLTYVGHGVSEQTSCDLSHVAAEVLPLLRSSVQPNVILKSTFQDELPPITADSNSIKQVVINLVTNARESIATTEGTVNISTGLLEQKEIESMTFVDSSEIELESGVFLRVKDTGSGMKTEILEKIFDPFFTTKFTGRGLGLSTVQGVVKAHSAYISVDSVPEVGTTVTILFPTTKVVESTPELSGIVKFKLGERDKVLLVDDEEIIRSVGKSLLEELGFSVLLTESGHDALRLFKKYQERIYCTICDLTMPEMDGWMVLEEIREIDRDAIFILASGFTYEPSDRKGKAIPTGHIQKPYKLDDLMKLLKKFTEKTEKI